MENLKLDGREFTGIEQSLSASQDDYVMGHLRKAGALEVLGDVRVKRTPRQKAEDLLTEILLSGRTHHILAGCLTEVGKKWMRAEADRNAAIFAEITDPDGKAAMRSSIVSFVIGFFQFGETLPATSRKSSSRGVGDPTESGEAPTSGTLVQ
jgi:hypothetical protein